MILFTSDTHWGHANVIKYCDRPFADVHSMNKGLTEAWNNKVSHKDTVYHLGDFSFGDPAEYIKHLNGRIFLVPGNHDRIKKFEQFVIKGKVVILPELHRCSLNGQYMTLSHYALRVWDKRHYGAWSLFGHSHGTMKEDGKSMDVGVDTTSEYAPYTFDQIHDIMAKRSNYKVDHH